MPDATPLHALVRDGPILSVGILTADLGHLADSVGLLESGDAPLVHIDVMDGVFCPMMTVGPPFVDAIKGRCLKDVHLMVTDPLSKVESYAAAGADMITFHLEGAPQPHRVLSVLGGLAGPRGGRRAIVRGVALNPSTPTGHLEPLLDAADYVLVLAIDPGWAGQRFLDSTARRLDEVRDMIVRSGRPIVLGVDGGVTRDNINEVARLGADVVVSGSAIFDGGDVLANLAFMRSRLAGSS